MITAAALVSRAALPTGPISGPDARRAAQQELSRSGYHRDDPSLLSRVVSWFFDQLGRLGGASGGQSALIVLGVILVVVVTLMLIRAGRPSRGDRSESGAPDPLRPAAGTDHARSAEAYLEAGRYAEALQEWLRAVVETLERRDVIDPRPGRTADDIARIGGARMPAAAEALTAATSAFDSIWFGARPATIADAQAGREAAAAVRAARVQRDPAGSAAGYAVPR